MEVDQQERINGLNQELAVLKELKDIELEYADKILSMQIELLETGGDAQNMMDLMSANFELTDDFNRELVPEYLKDEVVVLNHLRLPLPLTTEVINTVIDLLGQNVASEETKTSFVQCQTKWVKSQIKGLKKELKLLVKMGIKLPCTRQLIELQLKCLTEEQKRVVAAPKVESATLLDAVLNTFDLTDSTNLRAFMADLAGEMPIVSRFERSPFNFASILIVKVMHLLDEKMIRREWEGKRPKTERTVGKDMEAIISEAVNTAAQEQLSSLSIDQVIAVLQRDHNVRVHSKSKRAFIAKKITEVVGEFSSGPSCQ